MNGSAGGASWVRYPVWQHTFVSPSAFSRRAVVNYWGKYVHEVLVNHLGGLSLPRKSVVRLTDRPDMTFDVYRGRKTTIQYNNSRWIHFSKTKKIKLFRTTFIWLNFAYTVIILNIGTDRSEQTVQTQIRLLLMEQSDQGLLCLLFCLHLLNTILHCKIQLFQL